jgi:hypothetical protein
MTEQQGTRNDLYAYLQAELSRTLREVPFHYYKTYDGTVEYGHLLHPGDYQRLMPWFEWSPTSLRRPRGVGSNTTAAASDPMKR